MIDKKYLLSKRIKTLHDVIPDSKIPEFFKIATGREYTSKDPCVNDIRRMLMLYWNQNITKI